MTGPEHYKEAERIIQACQTEPLSQADALASATIAQAHATLALAAATAVAPGLWTTAWDEAIT